MHSSSRSGSNDEDEEDEKRSQRKENNDNIFLFETLQRYGYDIYEKEEIRHKALRKAIREEHGPKPVITILNRSSNLFTKQNPEYERIFKKDIKYLENQYLEETNRANI